jgi:protein TonB
MAVSTMAHVLVGLALIATIVLGAWNRTPVYVVNLVPTIAAVGSPTGQTQAAPAPPAPPAPAPTPQAKPEPAPREARQREPVTLPSASPPRPQLPSRPVALPRPGQKELPALTAPGERRPLPPPMVAAKPSEATAEARPAPPIPRGQPTGSVSGTGALTVDVGDFPHAWYLRQVLQKVEEHWQRQGQSREPEHKPLLMVEIQRDGSIRPPRVEKSSGNAFYDQAALRAIVEASPFPPLPQDWTKPSLRVMFRFELAHG